MAQGNAHGRADWKHVRQLYGQLTRVVDTGHINDHLAGRVAHAMARTCAAYDGEEELFVEHLAQVIQEVAPKPGDYATRFRDLYFDRRYSTFDAYLKKGHDSRRRPVPFEAAVETCRRLRDVNRLRDQLAGLPTGCVLGGSSSYGRFFNTVGCRDNAPSDIDLLLIVLDYDALAAVVGALRLVAGLREADLDSMEERVGHFPTVRSSLGRRERCIFSHKVRVWPATSPDSFLAATGVDGEYELSIHAFSSDYFDYLILRDRPRLDRGRLIYDYRKDKPDRADTQRSFAETVIEHDRVGSERTCPGGYVLPSQVCDVRKATPERGTRYYPGQHQNLILPEFELRWDLAPRRVYLPLYTFKVKLGERLRFERMQRPYEIQTLANSHTRRYAFAPYLHSRDDGR